MNPYTVNLHKSGQQNTDSLDCKTAIDEPTGYFWDVIVPQHLQHTSDDQLYQTNQGHFHHPRMPGHKG